MTLSIVIPAYNEGKTLKQNMTRLCRILDEDGIDFKLMLVDDGSSDLTWLAARELCEQDARINAIKFSRNFGKEAAICAGLNAIEGERFLVMDSDLQHPPRYIKDMMRVMDETGADIVDGVKTSRGKESLSYKIFAKSFYRILKWVSGMQLDKSSDFKLLDKKVVEALRQFGEGRIFFRGVCEWVGFDKVEFPFEVDAREGDVSHFSLSKRTRFALDSILAYTSKPLYVTVVAAILFFIGALAMGIQTLVNFFSGRAVSGFTTVILLTLIIGCVLSFSLGVIGAYISRIFDEVKARPMYIVTERWGQGLRGE